MELSNIVSIIRHRFGLIVAIFLVTALAIGLRLNLAEPQYEARVKLQMSAPEQEEVTLFGRSGSASLRDEMMIARNNFLEVLRGSEARDRTVKALGLSGRDATYALEVDPMDDSDFMYVRVRARSPELARSIANTHVDSAIAYYGEVRAKPAAATKTFLAREMEAAQAQLAEAEEALIQFKTQNRIGDLASEIASYQAIIQQLELERSRQVVTGATPASLEITDAQIERAKLEKERLVSLEPRYGALNEAVQQARANVKFLSEKYTEAALKAQTIQTASFIQPVEPASLPSAPEPAMSLPLIVLALVGSLGVGIMLALLVESLVNAFNGKPQPASHPATAGSKPLRPSEDSPVQVGTVPAPQVRDANLGH